MGRIQILLLFKQCITTVRKPHVFGPKSSKNPLFTQIGKIFKKSWKLITGFFVGLSIILTVIINLDKTPDTSIYKFFFEKDTLSISSDTSSQVEFVIPQPQATPNKSDPSSPSVTKGLRMLIVDKVTGDPIKGVSVKIFDLELSSITDNSGVFVIPFDKIKEFESYQSFEGTFSKDGYITLKQTIGLSEPETLKLSPENE